MFTYLDRVRFAQNEGEAWRARHIHTPEKALARHAGRGHSIMMIYSTSTPDSLLHCDELIRLKHRPVFKPD